MAEVPSTPAPSAQPAAGAPASKGSKKKFSPLKFIKRIFLVIFSLLLLAILSGVIIAWKFEDEAKGLIVSKLNEQLNAQVIVAPSDITFSVISSFPNASVNFHRIKVLDAIPDEKKDTLFKAGEVSLEFNIRDIFNKHYVVKEIYLKDLDVKIKIDKNGKDNFHFLKPSTDTTGATKKDTSGFALNEIKLKNVKLEYRNAQTKDDDVLTISNATFKGMFSSDEYTLKTDLEMFVDHLISGKTTLLQHRNIAIKTELDVKGTKYAISKSELKLDKLVLELKGSVDHQAAKDIIHLNIGGKNMDIKSACSWLPGKYKKDIEEFDSKGNFYFQADINGTLDKKNSPTVQASFGISKGQIKQTAENLTMKNVELKGSFNSAGKGMLDITSFSGNLPEGNIKGDFKMEDFSNPMLNTHMEGIVNLTELQKFLRIDTIESLSGVMKLNASFSGHIRKDVGNFVNEDKTSGSLVFSDVNMRLRKNNLKFDDFSGRLSLANNDVAVADFKGKVSHSDFVVDGSFKNMIAWLLLKDEPLVVDVTLKSKKIDLNDLLSDKANTTATKNDPAYKVSFNKYLDLTFHSQIDHLSFRKFEASDLQGVLRLKDKHLYADELTFKTMDGSITIKGDIDGTRSDSLKVTMDANLKSVNVTKMFTEMENFGQNTLMDKNVKGLLTAHAQMSVPCSADLNMNTAKLLVNCDVTIVNGELIKLESLKAMAKFISINELEDLKFANLTTPITIRNRVLSFPETQVNSNALDIEVSGSQDFDENVDYVFAVYLSEILAAKAKANRKESSDFIEQQDNEDKHRFRLYVCMKGPISNPKLSYDHKMAKDDRIAKRKDEKEKLKGILNEEFGVFKHDSLATKHAADKKKKEGDKFSINFDNDEQAKKKKDTKPDDGDF
jgi:hypothetical protein